MRDIDGAVGAGHQGGQLVQRVDLLGHDAAHLARRILGLAGKLQHTALKVGAGRVELAPDLGGHLAHPHDRLAEPAGGGGEALHHPGGGGLDGLAHGAGGACALRVGAGAQALEVARHRLTGDPGGLGQALTEFLGPVFGRAQGLLDHAAEATGLGLDVAGALFETGEGRLDRRLTGGEGLGEPRLDRLQAGGRAGQSRDLRTGALDQRAAAGVQRLGERGRLLERALRRLAQGNDLGRDLLGPAARLGGDLVEDRLDLLDAGHEALLDRAEIVARTVQQRGQAGIDALDPGQHAPGGVAHPLVGLGEGGDGRGRPFVQGRAQGLGRLGRQRRQGFGALAQDLGKGRALLGDEPVEGLLALGERGGERRRRPVEEA